MSEDRKKTIQQPAVRPREIASPSPPSSRRGFGSLRPSYEQFEYLDEDTAAGRTTETSIEIPPHLRATESKRALLRLVTGFNAGQVFAVDRRETIIGRGRDAHVRVEDAGVSRQHTRIVHALEGHYHVEDMGSTNGTFVGGRKVDRCELKSGDHVQVGPNLVLSFSIIDEVEEQLARQLYESSTRDALTKAFNRKYFIERLASEVAYAVRHKTRLAVVIFDLDHFKQVNDTLGHMAGDEVLRGVSSQVAKMIRVEDVFARYGGEEFVLIVRGIEQSNVQAFAERVRRAVESHVTIWEGKPVSATISVGVAMLEECGDIGTAEGLLLLSDERLYQAKRSGRNRVCGS